jgi:hypothetical protein
MIMHDVSEMDQFDLHWKLGRGEFDDLLEMAQLAPEQIHLFPITLAEGQSALVAIAIGTEAKKELEKLH